MHLAVIFSLFASYFGTQTPSQTVFVFDCMNTSGEHLQRFQSVCVESIKIFIYCILFFADNVKFMMESSLLGVRLSIVQLNDRNTSLNIDHIIKTMLFTTHNISPVGIIFNYDCPHSKSFISAVSRKKSAQFRVFEEVLCFSPHRPDGLPSGASGWFSRRTLIRLQFNSFEWLRFS